MSISAPTPPLLLTKRLTSFLHANTNPQIQTALLTTLSGKLLAHASPLPVSTLRTQCTVASSLWTIYASSNTTASMTEALPNSAKGNAKAETSAVTVQLTGAIVVIRKLRCGLLFVCIGPPADGPGLPDAKGAGGSATPRAQGAGGGAALDVPGSGAGGATSTPSSPPLLGTPSEAESVLSTGAATTASINSVASVGAAGIMVFRRHAEELARSLDEKLGSLRAPDDGLGTEVR